MNYVGKSYLPILGLLFVHGAFVSWGQEPKDLPTADASAPAAMPTPELPKRPHELSPALPTVTCKAGLITIAADNATMSSVLAALRPCVGVTIDLPDDAGSERTYINAGPATAREVLEALLGSSEYNYVIAASDTEPGKITSVVLMARTDDQGEKVNSNRGDVALTPARRAWLEMRKAARPEAVVNEGSGQAEEAAAPVTRETPEAVSPEKTGLGEAAMLASSLRPDTAAVSSGVGAAAVLPIEAAPNGASATPAVAVDSAAGVQPAPAAVAEAPEESSPKQEMQNKISSMEQLFEQRKQMIESQSLAKPQ